MSRVPTLALKSVSVPANAAPILLILVAGAAAGLLLFPYILVLLIVAGYLLIIPFTIRSQRWVAARPRSLERQTSATAGGAARVPPFPGAPTAGRWPGWACGNRGAQQ